MIDNPFPHDTSYMNESNPPVTPKPVAEADPIAEAEELINSEAWQHAQLGHRDIQKRIKRLLAHARQLREELSQLTRPIPKELVGNIEQLIGRAEVYLKEGSPSSEFKGLSAVMADWMELGKIFKELIPCVKLLVAQTLQLEAQLEIVFQTGKERVREGEVELLAATQHIAELERERDWLKASTDDHAWTFTAIHCIAANRKPPFYYGSQEVLPALTAVSKLRTDYNMIEDQRDSLQRMIDSAVRAKLSFVPSELGCGITKTHLTFSHMAEDSGKLTAMENKSVLILPADEQVKKEEE